MDLKQLGDIDIRNLSKDNVLGWRKGQKADDLISVRQLVDGTKEETGVMSIDDALAYDLRELIECGHTLLYLPKGLKIIDGIVSAGNILFSATNIILSTDNTTLVATFADSGTIGKTCYFVYEIGDNHNGADYIEVNALPDTAFRIGSAVVQSNMTASLIIEVASTGYCACIIYNE